MNNIFRKGFLLLTILLVSLQLSFLAPQTSHASFLEQAVTITVIDGEAKNLVNTTVVEIDEDDTAWDVLNEVAEVDYDEYDFGPMITGINKVYSDTESYQNWWSFIVNGKFAEVGASSFDVNHGDNLLFLLTDSMDENLEITVSATDLNGGNVIDETSVKLAPYATAHDAIVQAATEQGVTLNVSVHSEWLTFINDLDETIKEENEFWNLSVNQEPSMVGALSYNLKSGDVVSLQLETWVDPDDDGDDSGNDVEDPGNGDGTEEPGNDNEDGQNNDQGNNKDQNNEGSKTSEEQQLIKQVNKQLSVLANYVLDHNLATEYGQEWWVWALAKSGHQVPEQYIESVEAKLKEIDGDFRTATDLERVIIALSHAGVDASDFAAYDLIDKLVNHRQLEDPILINAVIYALIAINSGPYDVDEAFENKLIDFILSKELSDGGWAFFGNQPSADITGMALIALAPYQEENADVQAAIDRAVDYLSETQDENGGYYESSNGGYTSEAVSQVIIGLVSVGIDPTSSAFTKDKNLIEHLFLYQTEDGLYKHLVEDTNSNAFANQQAFLALAYYSQFINGDEIEDPTPKNPVENDEKEEENETNIDDEEVDPKQEPEEEGNEEDSTETVVQVNDEEGKQLPKTSTNIFNLLGIGLLLFTVGVIITVLQRKWKVQ